MEKIFKIGNILRVLRWLFIVLSLCTLLILIVQINRIICHCLPISFCELIFNWHFLKYLLIACFSLLTLYVAGKQLQKQTDVATITALTELRKLLTSEQNRNVHFILSSKEEQKTILDNKADKVYDEIKKGNKLMNSEEIPKIDIFNYLGTLELGILMVKRNLINWDTFSSQFGYRIENIFDEEDSDVHIKVRKNINDNKSYYKNLLWGYEKIRKYSFKSSV